MRRFLGFGLVAAFSLATLVACGSEDGEDGSGSVTFSAWGEEFIEQGIPAEELEDGWSVKFEQFLISLGGISVHDRAGKGSELAGNWLLDLVQPGPHELGTLDLTAKAWPLVGYAVRPVGSSTEAHESATDDDLELMQKGEYSVYVSGTATLDDVTKTFAWGFTNGTEYSDCVSEIDGKEVEGIIVPNGGDEKVQLTIHGDHFFYDDLASADAVPRFAPIAAADANDDGEVTLGELDAVSLVEIEEGTYGTGSASHIDDLGAFVRALTRSIGHFRGEGHCVEAAR
ncbi:MAG: hypothetical protein M3020_11880 [Myxococcota bacterium]|nr:hypothetical protein [Myxococcota bacterium]